MGLFLALDLCHGINEGLGLSSLLHLNPEPVSGPERNGEQQRASTSGEKQTVHG